MGLSVRHPPGSAVSGSFRFSPLGQFRSYICSFACNCFDSCLLNLNGNPLLGNLISIPGITGGGSSGGGGGILGGLLGGK